MRNSTNTPTYTPSNIMAVGDLHGRFSNFKDATEALGCVKYYDDGSTEWIGGSNTLLLHGDFLGDRTTQGLYILFAIRELRNQGAHIIALAGNHEEFFTGFLCGQSISGVYGGWVTRISNVMSQASGIKELRDYLGIRVGQSMPANVKNVAVTTSRWMELITEIEKLDLAYLDPTGVNLFLHTPPTENIMDVILSGVTTQKQLFENITAINKAWQTGFHSHMFVNSADKSPNHYTALTQVFLDTGNSHYDRGAGVAKMITSQQAALLYRLGCRVIAHGHEGSTTRTLEWIRIESNDTDYGKSASGDTRFERLPIRVYQTAVSWILNQKPVHIHTAESFDQLYAAIRAHGQIRGSAAIYSPDEMIQIIEEARRWKRDFSYITSAAGIYDRVVYLLRNTARP